MSEGKRQKIEVYQSRTFEKAFKRLSESAKDIVDEEIEKIEQDPNLGERKRGDLAHLWVHKFKIGSQEVLLGYSWVDLKLELYLLSLGSHENFYKKSKSRRNADLKFMS